MIWESELYLNNTSGNLFYFLVTFDTERYTAEWNDFSFYLRTAPLLFIKNNGCSTARSQSAIWNIY